MDYSGTLVAFSASKELYLFQSFCINGLLWNYLFFRDQSREIQVSILLYQWITLELHVIYFKNFTLTMFQSFCINGLLWNDLAILDSDLANLVSILLYQWITLELPNGL